MYLINDLIPVDEEAYNIDSAEADKRNSFLPYSLQVNNDTLIMGVLCNWQEKKYFLVYYTLEGNTASFRKYYDGYLSGAYEQYGYNYTDPIFDREGKFVCLGLDDKIFSLQADNNINLNLFNVNQFEKSIYTFKKMMRAIESDGNYLYLLYWNSIEKLNYYSKFSLIDNEIVENTPYTSTDHALACLLDDFDPMYIYIVGEDGSLRHYRMSEP